jgi:adenine deaminase
MKIEHPPKRKEEPVMPGLGRLSREQTRDLMGVALGEIEADIAIVDGDVVNVYTSEVLPTSYVLIKGDRIAYVGEKGKGAIGPSTKVIDAAGKTLIPGLIDGHVHTDWIYSMSEFSRYALKGGTTTIISEMTFLVYRLGYRGIIEYLKSVRDQPIKVFVTISPMLTLSQAVEEHAITLDELRRLLRRKEVVGLGEQLWSLVIAGKYPRVMDFMVETINAGKKVNGHTSGAKDNKLQAYIDCGVSSCHEPITAEEARERLRLGLFVLIREGETRQELEAVSKIKDEGIDLSRLALSTDGLGPWQLMEKGYMDFVVQEAIDFGFDPITAIKMATINTAQHFAIDDFVGGIAPGKYADIVIVPNLHTIRGEHVISKGQLVVKGGELLYKPGKYAYPKYMKNSIKLTRDLTADDFAVATSKSPAEVRAIDYVTSLITREAIVDIPVSAGRLCIDVGDDLLKVAAIERTHVPGRTFVGFIRGFKLQRGAVASSLTWDSSDIVVVGASEADMAQAVNRLIQLKGGIIVCADGKILAELPCPVAGLISPEPIETIAADLYRVQHAAEELGFPFPNLRTTLGILTTPAIPFLRICEDGLYNITQKRFVDLIV